jgi:hypothetical protein
MRAARKAERPFDFTKELPPPTYSEEADRTWDMANGNKQKIQRIESETVFRLHIWPVIKQLPLPVKVRFYEHVRAVPKDKQGGFLVEFLKSLPALYNHAEVMAAVTQQLPQKDKINDFFDHEIIPVPLAYASAFVARDKRIRELLHLRTGILKRNHCRYCFDLAELEEWLKTQFPG